VELDRPARPILLYQQIAFWDFIEADTRSKNYRKYLGQWLTRSLVAMRAEESSTHTVGRILLQLYPPRDAQRAVP
jgi:15-cis-phytoene desaturase